MRVFLVRHAESISNAGLVHQVAEGADWFDYSLTDKGFQQAQEVVQRIGFAADLIVTSRYLRAKQTAAPYVEANKEADVEEWPVEEFTYLDPIKYKGTTYMDREAERARYWTRGDVNYRDGGQAESFVDLIKRVDDLTTRLINRPKRIIHHGGERIVIFTHGQFTRALLWRHIFGCLPLNRESMQHFRQFDLSMQIPNTAILPIRVEDGQLLVGGFDACVAQLAEH